MALKEPNCSRLAKLGSLMAAALLCCASSIAQILAPTEPLEAVDGKVKEATQDAKEKVKAKDPLVIGPEWARVKQKNGADAKDAQKAEKSMPAEKPRSALKDDLIQGEAFAEDRPDDAKLRGTVKQAPAERKALDPFYAKLCKAEDPPVDLNVTFDAASANDIVPAFSQILKFNYMVDPQVKGAVTMSVNAKMTTFEVWQMFEQILWLAGSYCSYEGGVVHVMPFAKMPQERKALADHEPSANVEVDLVPVRNASSKDLVEKIQPFLTEGAKAQDVPHQNSIMVVEAPANLPKIKALIKLLDHKNKANWPQAVIRCQNVSATRIKNELASLLPVIGFPVTVDNVVAEPGTIHLLSLDRLQALVATAANQEALDELTHWVGILDRSDVGEQERVFVYKVVNGKADELTQALSAIFSVDGSSISPSSSGSSSSGSGSSSSSSGLSGLGSKSKSGSLGSTSSQSSSASGGTQQGSIKSSQGKSEDGPGSVFEIPVKVFADNVQNRLVIRTVPRAYATMNAVLERLDTAPAQVLLQVTVSEISLDDSNEYGIEFSEKITGGKNSVNSVFGTNYQGLNPGSTTDTGAKYYIYNPNDPNSKFAYLRAVAGKSKMNVLSSPQIMVINNSEAKISVGDEVPIVTSEITDTASTTADNTSLKRSIEYQDTGVILTVTPHITKGGMITMDLQQEVSDATKNLLTDIDSPVIQKRLVKTTMALRDGSTLFVAGLIREKANESTSSIPLFSDSEFLAKLFGYTTGEQKRTELVVMITAIMVDEHSNVEAMVRRYKDAMELIRRSDDLEYAARKKAQEKLVKEKQKQDDDLWH